MTAFDQAVCAIGAVLTLAFVVAPLLGGGLFCICGIALVRHSSRIIYGPGQPRWRISLGHLVGGLSLFFIGGTVIWRCLL